MVSIQLPIKGVFIPVGALFQVFYFSRFNPTPYQGSIYTLAAVLVPVIGSVSIQLPIKGVFIPDRKYIHQKIEIGFNPTPYQGSIYTQVSHSQRSAEIVSIQLPIKGVFIRTCTGGKTADIRFQSNSLSREYLYLLDKGISIGEIEKFQSNSLSREYLYGISGKFERTPYRGFNPTPYQGSIYTRGLRFTRIWACFNPTPYQGSIYTYPHLLLIRLSWSRFNPTPYQGSIYTMIKNRTGKDEIVSIQLPIKGVFILLLSNSLIIFSFQGSVSRMPPS